MGYFSEFREKRYRLIVTVDFYRMELLLDQVCVCVCVCVLSLIHI